MNSAIRRLSVVVLVMFLALMAAATYVQFIDAGSLNADSRNRRTLYREYGTFRGPIVVDGTAIAISTPVNDPFGYQRAYTDGSLYAPVTGFYSVVYGRTGIEQAQNTLLNGSDDSLFWTRLGDLLAGKEQRGASVELTIRAELQQVAADALGAQRGAVVALDPRTGEILAMVTSPSYDPNLLAGHTTADVVDAYQAYLHQPGDPLVNRAIAGDTYPPGSVFKLVTVAVALDRGYTADTPVYAPGRARASAHVHDHHELRGRIVRARRICRRCRTRFSTRATPRSRTSPWSSGGTRSPRRLAPSGGKTRCRYR